MGGRIFIVGSSEFSAPHCLITSAYLYFPGIKLIWYILNPILNVLNFPLISWLVSVANLFQSSSFRLCLLKPSSYDYNFMTNTLVEFTKVILQ